MLDADTLREITLLREQLHGATGADEVSRGAVLRLVNAGYALVLNLEGEVRRLGQEIERRLIADANDDVPELLARRRAVMTACRLLRRDLEPLAARASAGDAFMS